MSQEALWDKAIEVCKPQKWGRNQLYRRDNAGVPRFCALGMIGYARWGQQWEHDLDRIIDAGVVDDDAYDALTEDPETSAMVKKLAGVIREQHPELWDRSNPEAAEFTEDTTPQTVVYAFNDQHATSKDLRAYFEKARAK